MAKKRVVVMARKFAALVFDALVVMGKKLRRAIPATIIGARGFLRRLEVSPGQVQALVAVLTLWFLWNQLGINTKIALLQEQQSRFALAPKIVCSFTGGSSHDDFGTFFEIRNEGGDTAFCVWYSAQNVLVLDTLLIYDRYRPEGFAAVADHSGAYGLFTSDLSRALAPSERREFRADVHNSRVGSVSHILGGVQMVEISCVYSTILRSADMQRRSISLLTTPVNSHPATRVWLT